MPFKLKIPSMLLLLLLTQCGTPDNTKQISPLSEFSTSLIFPYQAEHVHGPTLAHLPNGDILAAWFQGSGERWADDVRIMGARLASGDSVWSEPFLMADTPGFPDINPMIFLDNQERLWLMWYAVLANQWETSILKYRISGDYQRAGAPIWSWQDVVLVKPGDKAERGIQPGDRFVEAARAQLTEYEVYFEQDIMPKVPERQQATYRDAWAGYKAKIDSLAKGENMVRRGRLRQNGEETNALLGYPFSRRIGWQTKNKPFILGERMIVPLYSDGFDCSLFAITDDWGETWQFSNPVMGGIGIQPTIAITQDSTLVAYLRDNGPPPQRMQRTVSADKGMTWSIAKDTEIPNSGAGFDMITLQNGDWLMVYNDTEEGRHRLAVSVSEDGGKTWKWTRYLENDDRPENATRSHYPAVIQAANGRIHTVYSYHHNDRPSDVAKSVKYATFGVDWVKAGDTQ